MRLASDQIKLIEPTIDLRAEFLDLLEDHQQAGEVFFNPDLPLKTFSKSDSAMACPARARLPKPSRI